MEMELATIADAGNSRLAEILRINLLGMDSVQLDQLDRLRDRARDEALARILEWNANPAMVIDPSKLPALPAGLTLNAGRDYTIKRKTPRFQLPPFFFVFDVESLGLHGEGFAVAGAVLSKGGINVEEFCYCSDRRFAQGAMDDRQWVDANVPQMEITHPATRALRSAFWEKWCWWKKEGAVMVADCNWPVEARFLSQCVDDAKEVRNWEGPYPILDLGSILFANGKDPLAEFPRLPSELPKHHPLMDARQSARILMETINQTATAH